MVHNIVSSEGDLDHCAEAQMNVYIVLKFVSMWRSKYIVCCVTRLLGLGMAIEMHPISCHEPRGTFTPKPLPNLVRGAHGPSPPLTNPFVVRS